MDVATKLPTMEDTALVTLRTNAERLIETGTSAQKSAALALMPFIDAELSVRSAARLRKKAETLAARRGAKAKPVAEASS